MTCFSAREVRHMVAGLLQYKNAPNIPPNLRRWSCDFTLVPTSRACRCATLHQGHDPWTNAQLSLLRANPSKDGDAEPRGFDDSFAMPAGPPADRRSIRLAAFAVKK
jgi:hypothetical protein